MEAGGGAHVAVLAFPFGGHVPPLLNVVWQLASAAPELAFSFFTTAKSRRGLPPLPGTTNVHFHDVGDGMPEGHVPSERFEEMEMFLGAAEDNFRRALEAASKERGKVSCIVSDSFLWVVGLVAAQMDLPWVAVWSPGLSSLSAHLHTDLIRDTIGTRRDDVEGRLEEALTFVPSLAQFRVRDLPEGIITGPLHSVIPKLLHRMAQELPRAQAVLVNTVQGMEPSPIFDNLATILQRCLPAGPMSLMGPPLSESDPHSCMTWLDSRAHSPHSVIYVSFGTTASPPLSELVQLAVGLESSGAHFLWAINENVAKALPHEFLQHTRDRALIVPWAPQRGVLGHVAVGAFVGHAGWNSVVESIACGVPLICRPFFGDHIMNERLVSHVMGIGISVKGGAFTSEGVMDALDLILHKEEGRKMRDRLSELKKLVNGACGPSGSSTKSIREVLHIVKGNL